MGDLIAKLVPDNTVVTVPRAQATEVEPNTYLVTQPPSLPPLTGRHTWRRREDGAYEPVIELRSALIPLSEWNPKRYGCSKQTIQRLVIAGFVRGDMPGPSTLVIDLDSFYRHLDAVRSEPLFWNEERLARFAAARMLHNKGLGGLGHRRRKIDRDQVLEAVQQILDHPGTLNQLPSVKPPRAEARTVSPSVPAAPTVPTPDQPELFSLLPNPTPNHNG